MSPHDAAEAGWIAGTAPVTVFETIDSTNLEARRRAGAGDFGPAWLLARTQTAGLGRRGRAWRSAPGNLHATYLGPNPEPVAQAALLGFAVGVAVAEWLATLLPAAEIGLKWPNDIFLGGAKAGGVLLEAGQAPGWVAVGVGLNLMAAPDGPAPYPTTAVARWTGGLAPAPEAALAAIAPRFAAWANTIPANGFEAVRAAWQARAYGLGRLVEAEVAGQPVRGVARGLAADGALELESAEGPRRIAAGDVHFSRTAGATG